MLPEMVFIQFWSRFHAEKFKKLGEPALHFDGAVLKISTCRGMPQSRGLWHWPLEDLSAGYWPGKSFLPVFFLPPLTGDWRPKQSGGRWLPGTSTTVPGSAMWVKISRSADMKNSVQKSCLKIKFYQIEIEEKYYYKFSLINVKKSLNVVHVLIRKSQKIRERIVPG